MVAGDGPALGRLALPAGCTSCDFEPRSLVTLRGMRQARPDPEAKNPNRKKRPDRRRPKRAAAAPRSSPASGEPQILERPVASLRASRRNPRTHSERQIRQIAASIEAFGFTNPVLIDKQGTVIAGHGRVRAAKQLGLAKVPTLCLEHLSEAQVRAYVIADNRLAENAGWDRDLLAIELQELSELDLGFELEVIGFETPELDLIMGDPTDPESDPADTLEPVSPDTAVVSQPGDLWQIGRHRLLSASALEAGSYTRLLYGKKAAMVFTDPPYNVPIKGHVSGLGQTAHGAFAMASEEMSASSSFQARVSPYINNPPVHGLIGFIQGLAAGIGGGSVPPAASKAQQTGQSVGSAIGSILGAGRP